MPSGKDISVERVVNGTRDVRFFERIPIDQFVVTQAGEDGHVHIVMGTEDELTLVGVEVPKEDLRDREKAEKAEEREAKAELKEATAEEEAPAAKTATKTAAKK